MAVGFLHNRKVFGGGGVAPEPVEEKDICFWDYDGTLLHSYTIAEANALAALPALPIQTSLTCQGWNHTLTQAKPTIGTRDIGATYITSDGKTWLFITLDIAGRKTVQLCWTQTVSNGVTIDWGDGSATETVAGTSTSGLGLSDSVTYEPVDPVPFVKTSHTYAATGDYIIKMAPTTGCTLGLGGGMYVDMYGERAVSIVGGLNDESRRALTKCNVGSNTKIEGCGFYGCANLTAITIPNGVDASALYAFFRTGLKCVIYPSGIQTIGNQNAAVSRSLRIASLPQSVINIGASAFYYDGALGRCALPQSVESLGGQTFYETNVGDQVIPANMASNNGLDYGWCQRIKTVVYNGATCVAQIFMMNMNLTHMKFSSALTAVIGYTIMPAIAELDFSECVQVPTLESTSVFINLPSDCKMLIPSALYATWSTDTNWSAFASYMVAV